MSVQAPACKDTINKHCEICVYGSMTCCECGDAMIPYHPDIEGLWQDGKVRLP